MSNQAGKGDKYRPVNKNKFDKNFDSINWHRKKCKHCNQTVDEKYNVCPRCGLESP